MVPGSCFRTLFGPLVSEGHTLLWVDKLTDTTQSARSQSLQLGQNTLLNEPCSTVGESLLVFLIKCAEYRCHGVALDALDNQDAKAIVQEVPSFGDRNLLVLTTCLYTSLSFSSRSRIRCGTSYKITELSLVILAMFELSVIHLIRVTV